MYSTATASVEQIFTAVSILHAERLGNEIEEHLEGEFPPLYIAWTGDWVYNRALDIAEMRMQGVFGELRGCDEDGYRARRWEQEMFPGRGSNILYDLNCPVTSQFDIDKAFRLARKLPSAKKAIRMAQQ